MHQKVTERQKVDQGAIRKRVAKVAETIGEPVDLNRDSGAELTRKAKTFREKIAAGGAKRVRIHTTGATAGKTFTMPERGAKAGSSLVDALGAVVAFTPNAARKWVAEHPDQAAKVASLAASVPSRPR
jgi:hypothetical protein